MDIVNSSLVAENLFLFALSFHLVALTNFAKYLECRLSRHCISHLVPVNQKP